MSRQKSSASLSLSLSLSRARAPACDLAAERVAHTHVNRCASVRARVRVCLCVCVCVCTRACSRAYTLARVLHALCRKVFYDLRAPFVDALYAPTPSSCGISMVLPARSPRTHRSSGDSLLKGRSGPTAEPPFRRPLRRSLPHCRCCGVRCAMLGEETYSVARPRCAL